jgi:hypothetical protein
MISRVLKDLSLNQMDRFLATANAIVSRYENSKIRLPNPAIKTALNAFKRRGKDTLFLDYFNEHRVPLLADTEEFLSSTKSAVIESREAYVAVSAFYLLAKELAQDIEKNYDISKIDRATAYKDYPDLKLPLGFQLNLWKVILSVLPENDKDRTAILAKITSMEESLSRTTPVPVPVRGGPSTEQLGEIVTGVSKAFQKPRFQEMVQGIMGDIQTSDISQIFPKIFGVLQDPEFRGIIEEVAKPMAEKQ